MGAYGIKYMASWGSRKGLSGYLYIQENGYTGPVTELTLKGFDKTALSVQQKFKDWDSPIMGKVLSFTIENNFADFYSLMPLLTATERQYFVSLYVTAPSSEYKSLFEGFINTGQTSQKMLQKQEIHLVASTYLSKLNNYTTSLVDTRQNVFFVNLIDDILSSVGQYNLRINSSLWTGTDPGSGKTLFNTTGINTEVFWEDNVTRKNNLEILKMILVSFNCFIYWKNGYWYIERFDDIWNENPVYVEYQSGTIYNSTMTGTIINGSRNLIDIQSLQFMNTSQTLFITPGYKTIKLNLNTDKHLLLNLIDPVFPAVDDIPDVASGAVPLPDLKTWEKESKFSWLNVTSPNSMTNAIKKFDLGTTDSDDYYEGLYTRFRVGIVATETNINIEFNYWATISGSTSGGGIPPGSTKYSFKFHWWLREASTNYFLVYNASDDTFSRVQNTGGTDLTFAVNTTEEVNQSNFDEKTKTYKVSLSIAVGTLYAVGSIQDFVLAICIPELLSNGNSIHFADGIAMEQYGDVKVVVNNPADGVDNEIIGTTNTLFLDKKEIDIDIADIANINYTNGILTGADLLTRTVNWNNGGSTSRPLIDWLMIDKFRIYNVSRQRIKGTVFRNMNLEVFDLFNDSNQPDKKFILTGYIYNPVFDSYDVDLWEFDIDTVINLLG